MLDWKTSVVKPCNLLSHADEVLLVFIGDVGFSLTQKPFIGKRYFGWIFGIAVAFIFHTISRLPPTLWLYPASAGWYGLRQSIKSCSRLWFHSITNFWERNRNQCHPSTEKLVPLTACPILLSTQCNRMPTMKNHVFFLLLIENHQNHNYSVDRMTTLSEQQIFQWNDFEYFQDSTLCA